MHMHLASRTRCSVAYLPQVLSRSLGQRHLEVLEWNTRASEQAHLVHSRMDVFGRHVRAVSIPLAEEKQEEEEEAEEEEEKQEQEDVNGHSE